MRVLVKTGFPYCFYLVLTNGLFKVCEKLAMFFLETQPSILPKRSIIG